MNENPDNKIDLMRQEIDALQIAIGERSKPWYGNMPILLSIIALLFSFGTTYVSYHRTKVQDIENKRQELRTVLQRLAALPKENVDARRTYATDPASMSLVSGFINQENALLARHAAEVAKSLPADSVSAAEYHAIAIALQNCYDLEAANTFLENAIKVAKDFNTEISALRAVAGLRFSQGHPETGRVEYQKALDIFSKYPGYDSYTKTSTNVWTELSWAFSEAGNGLSSLANQHIESAEALVAVLPPSPGKETLNSQIAQAKKQFATGIPVKDSSAGSQLGLVPAATPK
jgi:tetratricopeptide (TPR) repeat protein